MKKLYDIYKTIKEIDGKYTCTNCKHEWSAMLGDNEIPLVCECQISDDEIVAGDIVYNPLSNVIMPIDDEDDLTYVNQVYDKIKVKSPFILMEAFKKTVFTIGGNAREFNFFEMIRLSNLIKKHLNTCVNMHHYLDCYQNFLEKIDDRLNKEEENWKKHREDKKYYHVGEDFAMFTNSETEMGMCDNHAAEEIIRKVYEKQFPNHTLEFDSESSYCCVYTECRPEAKRFLEFTYREFIRPTLEPWFEGYEEFQKLMENATDEDNEKN